LLVLPGVQDGHMAAEKIKYDIFGITREPWYLSICESAR
jgi:hypothetical protein